jgi:hypothetical protein
MSDSATCAPQLASSTEIAGSRAGIAQSAPNFEQVR